jgi:cell division protein FtsI/penicillin-binding protein 2
MRRVLVLTGGALIAGAAMLAGSGAPTAKPAPAPSATIPGAPLVSEPEPEVAKPAPAPAQVEVQLDKLERVGDHYEAPLADGKRVTLTLDPDLQELAEKLLDEARAPRGAIVAMAPDGRILALAGRTDEPKGSKHGKPDWHLATDVWAPAASVFKLVTASALVESGVDPDDKIRYHGGIRSVVESNLRDDKRDNSSESLTYGVAHSNNAIVGKLAYQHLEPSALDKLAHDLTALPAFAVPATAAELALPHDKNLAFAQAAAGFAGSRLSVLGGALLAATFADDGQQPVPRLVADPAKPAHRVLAEKTARAVAKMMVATCDFGSAAKSFRRHKVTVAGKTGTLTTTTPFYMEHSWFVGYAPADKPQIIVSVLLGNPESWHLRGHEAARRLIDRALAPPARSP